MQQLTPEAVEDLIAALAIEPAHTRTPDSRNLIFNFFASLKPLKKFTTKTHYKEKEMLSRITDSLVLRDYKDQEDLFHEGEYLCSFYFLLKGKLRLIKAQDSINPQIDDQIEKQQSQNKKNRVLQFGIVPTGSSLFKQNTVLDISAKSIGASTVACMSAIQFVKLCQEIQDLKTRRMRLFINEHIYKDQALLAGESSIFTQFRQSNFKKGAVVYGETDIQDEQPSYVYLIFKGRVKVQVKKEVQDDAYGNDDSRSVELRSGEMLGLVESIVDRKKGRIQATVVTEQANLLRIAKDVFFNSFNEKNIHTLLSLIKHNGQKLKLYDDITSVLERFCEEQLEQLNLIAEQKRRKRKAHLNPLILCGELLEEKLEVWEQVQNFYKKQSKKNGNGSRFLLFDTKEELKRERKINSFQIRLKRNDPATHRQSPVFAKIKRQMSEVQLPQSNTLQRAENQSQPLLLQQQYSNTEIQESTFSVGGDDTKTYNQQQQPFKKKAINECLRIQHFHSLVNPFQQVSQLGSHYNTSVASSIDKTPTIKRSQYSISYVQRHASIGSNLELLQKSVGGSSTKELQQKSKFFNGGQFIPHALRPNIASSLKRQQANASQHLSNVSFVSDISQQQQQVEVSARISTHRLTHLPLLERKGGRLTTGVARAVKQIQLDSLETLREIPTKEQHRPFNILRWNYKKKTETKLDEAVKINESNTETVIDKEAEKRLQILHRIVKRKIQHQASMQSIQSPKKNQKK